MGEAVWKDIDAGVLWDGSPAIRLIREYLEDLSRKCRLRTVVLIGSRARGDWKPWSYIDLLLIVESEEDKKQLRIGVIDPRAYTWKELLRAIERCEIEVIEAMEFGKLLLDDGSWRKARAVYEKIKENSARVLGYERVNSTL